MLGDLIGLMDGFPPEAAGQVTLDNWRTAPFNHWAFHHVREIVPSAEIANDPDEVWDLSTGDTEALAEVAVAADDGRTLNLDAFLAETETDGVVVLKDGRVVLERYAYGNGPHTPHILMSVSKSMLGLLAGILADKGALDLERPVTDLLPEVSDTAYRGATVRQLLDMRVGLAFDEDYLALSGPIIEYRKATNWNPVEPDGLPVDLRSFFSTLTESDGPHGRGFHYVSPNTDLLGWVIERATGRRYADLMAEHLWRPLGAERAGYITVDRLGAPRAAGGMCVTVRDLARVGLMLASGGARNGRSVVPEAWVRDIATAGDPAAWQAGKFVPLFPDWDMHYRAKWYVHRGNAPMLFGVGVHGQNLFVDAERGLVIAKCSSQALPLDEGLIRLTARWVDAVRRAWSP